VLEPPVIPALRKLRQEDGEFKGSLGYIVRSCLKSELINCKFACSMKNLPLKKDFTDMILQHILLI
jgi:hypothetical protein